MDLNGSINGSLVDGWISVGLNGSMDGSQIDGWISVDRWMDLRLMDGPQWIDGWVSD